MTVQRAGAWGSAIPGREGTFSWWRYSTFIVAAFVLMLMLILYVWSHVRMTQLEYRVAAELNRQEQLLDEQRKLKMQIATLKSPQRIETIARESLNMTYPEQHQVIVVK
jgi:cell division protein FtsL